MPGSLATTKTTSPDRKLNRQSLDLFVYLDATAALSQITQRLSKNILHFKFQRTAFRQLRQLEIMRMMKEWSNTCCFRLLTDFKVQPEDKINFLIHRGSVLCPVHQTGNQQKCCEKLLRWRHWNCTVRVYIAACVMWRLLQWRCVTRVKTTYLGPGRPRLFEKFLLDILLMFFISRLSRGDGGGQSLSLLSRRYIDRWAQSVLLQNQLFTSTHKN